MSRALEIAEERFAKGEITKDEFEVIKSSLGNVSVENPTVTSPPSLNETPPPVSNMASSDPGKDFPEWLPKAIGGAALYLLACFVVWFGVGIQSIMYNGVMKGCNNPNSALCQCVAKAGRDEVTFLLSPFQMVGVFIDKDFGLHCIRVRS